MRPEETNKVGARQRGMGVCYGEEAGQEAIQGLGESGEAAGEGWVVYKQFLGHRGEPQGDVLQGFEMFFKEFSVNFRTETRTKNIRTHKNEHRSKP